MSNFIFDAEWSADMRNALSHDGLAWILRVKDSYDRACRAGKTLPATKSQENTATANYQVNGVISL